MRSTRAKQAMGRLVQEVAPRAATTLLSATLALLVALAIVLSSPVADARSSFDSAYGFERTYNAALRLVRIDMGLKVTEKDDQSGYLMFEYRGPDTGPKATSGSMEFIRPREPDGPVRVVVQLPQMPRYHEQVLVDSLARKMKQEYGDPPERPRIPKAPPPPVDAGPETDADGDAE
jgi:hypothetical protein